MPNRIFVYDETLGKVVEVKFERPDFHAKHFQFEPFFDMTFNREITSQKQYDRLMKKGGYVSTRDYKHQDPRAAEACDRARFNVKRFGQSSQPERTKHRGL